MNQPSVFSCVVPVLPATSARRPNGVRTGLPGALVDGAAQHVDQFPGGLVRQDALGFVANWTSTLPFLSVMRRDKNRRAVLAAGGEGAVSGDHFQQGNRAGAER